MSNRIKACGMRPGLAINPSTKINDEIIESIEKGRIDVVMIMTVGTGFLFYNVYILKKEPGFGGQKFMKDMMGKV